MKRSTLFTVSAMGFLLLLAPIFAMSETNAPEKDASAETQQVVVHLSHFTDDLHRCFMALEVATALQQSGAQVTLFLDLEGVRLAERRQLLDMTWGSSQTPLATHYEDFTAAGGKVVLCPHCAKSARIGDMALKRYAEIGTKESIVKLLLGANKVMDY